MGWKWQRDDNSFCPLFRAKSIIVSVSACCRRIVSQTVACSQPADPAGPTLLSSKNQILSMQKEQDRRIGTKRRRQNDNAEVTKLLQNLVTIVNQFSATFDTIREDINIHNG